MIKEQDGCLLLAGGLLAPHMVEGEKDKEANAAA